MIMSCFWIPTNLHTFSRLKLHLVPWVSSRIMFSVGRSQGLEPSFAAFPGRFVGSWIVGGAGGTCGHMGPVPIWDTGTVGRRLA